MEQLSGVSAQLSPPFKARVRSLRILTNFAKAALKVAHAKDEDEEDRRRDLEQTTRHYLESARDWPKDDRQMLTAAGLVVADLIEQGWHLRFRAKAIEVRASAQIDADVMAEKARVRQQEIVKRDEQLRQPAVREFIRSMEHRRLFGTKFVSIFSLMRDGRELAESLRRARSELTNGTTLPLDKVTAPYLQFVSPEARCPHTGFALQDIWRYFRHTWSNQYTSVPGRSMLFLVRDGAVENHPVIGICALSSPIVQIRERDEWIGWQPTSFLEEARRQPSAKIAKWFQSVVDDAIDELYIDDFVDDELVSPKSLRNPTPQVIAALFKDGAEQRKRHHRFMRSVDYKQAARSKAEPLWDQRARTHLFRSKRALSLAGLLEARMLLTRHCGEHPSAAGLTAFLGSRDGDRVAKKIVKRAKAERVGIAMADISVCGAVQPYNAILGGKLVSMLAASPEVVGAYRRRYKAAVSEIASSMAGRPIIRPPTLVFLGTTSLYGGGSSQYNRIRIPCERLGGAAEDSIVYERLGMSQAFGTSHYSEDTIDALGDLVQQNQGGQRVNSIFGEGVSPKLRKVREALDLLDFPSDILLRHGRQRIVYGVTLIRNTRDFLLGIDRTPKYLCPSQPGESATKAIVDWWKARWLKGRIASDDVLAEVSRHTPVHPIRHGARVLLPHTGPQEELPFGAQA